MTYTLYQGDCLEVLPTLAAQSVDAVICDPPYGTTACAWDSVIPLTPMWEQLKRVIKPRGAIVLFAAQPFTSALVMSNPQWFRYSWVWEKDNAGIGVNAKIAPLRYHEDVCVFFAGASTYNPQMWNAGKPSNHRGSAPKAMAPGREAKYQTEARESEWLFPKSIIRFDKPKANTGLVHPTQKPLDLLAYLVRTYTNPGDAVLDFAMGSGTTGVACRMEGRNFIGIELDPHYYAIAERRIANAQPPLFVADAPTVPEPEQTAMFAEAHP